MNILNYIPTGHRNAVTRETLHALTRMSDRKIRDLITEANKSAPDDVLIINLQDGMGYFRPDDNEDALIRQWMRLGGSRQTNFEMNVSEGDRYLKWKQKKQKQNKDDLDGQMNIFDFLKGG